jgi:hypothetical protein
MVKQFSIHSCQHLRSELMLHLEVATANLFHPLNSLVFLHGWCAFISSHVCDLFFQFNWCVEAIGVLLQWINPPFCMSRLAVESSS